MHPLSKASLSLDAYENGSYVVFDFETTNIKFGSALQTDNRIVMVAWKEKGKKVRHHYGNILEAKEFWQAIERADVLVAYNAKFDAHWLLRLGYDITEKLWFDPMIAEYVRLGNRFALLNLGDTSKRYGYKGKEYLIDSLMKSGVCPSEMPVDKLIARCRRDVITTEQVMAKQVKKLPASGRLKLVLTRCLLMPILTVMEATGMCLDKKEVEDIYKEYLEKLNVKKRELDEFTGGINPNSPDQIAHYLFGGQMVATPVLDENGKKVKGEDGKPKMNWVPNQSPSLKFPERKDAKGRVRRNKSSKKWPDGKPKTDKHVMNWLKTQAKTAKQKKFIELKEVYGKLNAAVVKNLEFFKGVVTERDGGIFYGKFNQCNTSTHRLSSSGLPQRFELFGKEKSVQFQNMPRIFKKLFTVRDPDYVMAEGDGSQLEFRVAAFLGQDSQAMADIRDPRFDAHIKSASVMNEREYEQFFDDYKAGDKEVKLLRQDAKSDTFKPLFGGTTGTDAQELWYREFQDRYSELYQTQEGWVSEVLGSSDGCLVTPWGLRFYWQYYLTHYGTPMSSVEHKAITPSVFNYPVQSLATAEIIPIAIIYLFYRCKKQGLRVNFVNTVHDSVIAEVHKDDLEEYKQTVFKAFTHDVYRYLSKVYGLTFNVPLGCEVGWGTHWSGVNNQEESIDVEPTGE